MELVGHKLDSGRQDSQYRQPPPSEGGLQVGHGSSRAAENSVPNAGGGRACAGHRRRLRACVGARGACARVSRVGRQVRGLLVGQEPGHDWGRGTCHCHGVSRRPDCPAVVARPPPLLVPASFLRSFPSTDGLTGSEAREPVAPTLCSVLRSSPAKRPLCMCARFAVGTAMDRDLVGCFPSESTGTVIEANCRGA